MSEWNKYEPTAARTHGRPGREVRPKSIMIDVHSHVGVPRAAEFVKPHLAATAMPLVTFANAETRTLNQKQEADMVARAPLDRRLADLSPQPRAHPRPEPVEGRAGHASRASTISHGVVPVRSHVSRHCAGQRSRSGDGSALHMAAPPSR